MQTQKQPLAAALEDWADMQAVLPDNTVILVRDFTCYGDPCGIIVKINGEEPEGINNAYRSAGEIECDLVKVVPGYVKGSAIWQEGEYDD